LILNRFPVGNHIAATIARGTFMRRPVLIAAFMIPTFFASTALPEEPAKYQTQASKRKAKKRSVERIGGGAAGGAIIGALAGGGKGAAIGAAAGGGAGYLYDRHKKKKERQQQ
jgi:outer membrane lipoprotein SlyB